MAYHLCGTCRMESDSEKVAMADDELRVRGLHVVDASITHGVPSSNTSTTAFLIAGKALDDVAGRPLLVAQASGAAVTRHADDLGRFRLTRLVGS